MDKSTVPMQCHSACEHTDNSPVTQLWYSLACWITPGSVAGHDLTTVVIEENSNHKSTMIEKETNYMSDEWYDFDHNTPELKGSMQNNDN